MLIKLDNLDCFRFKNYKTAIFLNLEECIKICKNENINIFIKYKNMVYYRKEDYKDCIKNIVYVKGATMYIYNIKLKYYINNLDRINRYTAGINEKKLI